MTDFQEARLKLLCDSEKRAYKRYQRTLQSPDTYRTRWLYWVWQTKLWRKRAYAKRVGYDGRLD